MSRSSGTPRAWARRARIWSGQPSAVKSGRTSEGCQLSVTLLSRPRFASTNPAIPWTTSACVRMGTIVTRRGAQKKNKGRGRGCILGAAGGEHREPLLPIGVTDGERQRLNGRVITPDHPARLVFFRPLAGHFPNRAEYPLDAVRLLQVAGSPQRQRLRLGHLICPPPEQDAPGFRRQRPALPQDLEAGEGAPAQVEVQQQNPRPVGLEEGQRLLARRHPLDAIPLLRQETPEGLAQFRLIIHHQDRKSVV